MSSKEKREIVQNAPFGVVAGLLMGGPAGAVVAGLTSVGLGVLEERQDEELRRREYERKHPDPLKEQQKRREAETRWATSSSNISNIHQLLKHPNIIGRILDIGNKIHVEADYSLNDRSILEGKAETRCNQNVIVRIYQENFGQLYGHQPIIIAKGKLKDCNEFNGLLENDAHNPDIEMFNLNGYKFRQKYYRNISLRYMYTTDGGNHFIIYAI